MGSSHLVTGLAAVALLAGCAAGPAKTVTGQAATEPGGPAPASTTAPPSPDDVGANELGLVPILMYHRIVAEPDSVYERTPSQFRAELQRLAREGYVPITTRDFVRGRIDIPAGAHPVVLTFDDGDPSVLRLDERGRPARGTAVRILLDVAAGNPGFRPVASVYVNAAPFGGGSAGARALRWLRGHGFEVGNHTYRHTNLAAADAAAVRDDIRRGHDAIRAALPGYRPATLALPFGVRPDPSRLAIDGPGYDYGGALLVGARPAPPPYSADFEAAAIPRVRSQSMDGQGARYGSAAWLDRLSDNPGSRYTSDGNSTTVSFPRGSGTPAERFADSAEAY